MCEVALRLTEGRLNRKAKDRRSTVAEYLLLMHDLTLEGAEPVMPDWGPYLAGLTAKGVFCGGSAIGGGTCVRKDGNAPEITRHLGGYIKIECDSLEIAKSLLAGNPVYEAGGAVEIRELPVTG
jgi:hypothetical protein